MKPTDSPAPVSPRLVSAAADAAFAERARAVGLDPANRWVGGYVDYEWGHLRPLLAAYGIDVAGRRALEFGANVGASAIVLAVLGADVDAVDVSEEMIDLARSNAERYGHSAIRFHHVPDTRVLPFADASFDLIGCNSVLEYVHPDHLAAVQRELDRVLRPGGLLLVTGTSSRLWPRETHSGNWFGNWLPRAVDRLLPGRRGPTRGVWPWQVRNGFGPGYRNLDAADGGRAFIAARAAMEPPHDTRMHRLIRRLAAALGVGPGLLMNNLSCVLAKAPPR